ncbi:MAG: HDOD domain-containing protein [Proteobacteria bacterium]|nr:HDOD domain-containing protein [Pseudomonadota bacterium]
MQTNIPDDPAFHQGFIARQAVFDAKRSIWGYEIFYRQKLEPGQSDTDHKAMLEVATRAFLSPQWQQSPNSYLLVALDPKADPADIAGVLPKGRSVLKISEDTLAAPGMQDTLVQLRQENYLIALGDFTGKLSGTPLMNMVDILAVNMLSDQRDALIMEARLQSVQRPMQIMAKRVEDVQTFAVAKNAGCTLFQGFFFQKPERISSKVVSSSLAGSLGILKMIEQEDPDISALAQAIQKDVSLSYRLLKFLNSPYFGFAREVSSIKVALILAGWQQMRTWLRLVLITEMKPKHKPSELIFLSAQRGRFLELAALRTGGRRMNSERMLLLGLFSLLESIFDMQMDDIVGSLPLDQELKDTLCLRPTPLAPWLGLVHSFERADWDDLETRFVALGVDPVVVAACYTESMQWAHAIFNFLN